MKNIKIVTYCTWTSPGSVLQALGLSKALRQLDCDPSLYLDEQSLSFKKIKINSPKNLIYRLFEEVIGRSKKKAYNKRVSFIKKNIPLQIYSDYKQLEAIAKEDSCAQIIAGSDQIWNPGKCDPVFFLRFADGKIKSSYAASMGDTRIKEEKKEEYKRLINSFDHISVREQQCADIIGTMTEKKINVNIDPTFLLTAEEWREYEVDYKVKEPYILVYMLYFNSIAKDKIMELKKRTGLPVYAISSGLSKVKADKHLYDVGIGEFLWLIDHAKYVVTSSFHGVAFSTIFNKRYAVVNNPALPSRIDNLSNVLSIPKVDISELDAAERSNFDEVNKRITEERIKAMTYLKGIIE